MPPHVRMAIACDLNKSTKRAVLSSISISLLPDLFEDEAFTRVRINRLFPDIGFTFNVIIKQIDDDGSSLTVSQFNSFTV